MIRQSDTIAAIATAPGYGGIGILRFSGPDALPLLKRLFLPVSGGAVFKPRQMHYGQVIGDGGDLLDEALAVYMPGPHSATGEDVGEIHCHGGPGVAPAALEAALACGARLAGAGEFSKRAYLNGKIDLTQAEAVNELVHSATREGARLAAAKLGGALGRQVDAVNECLYALRVKLTLAVDFPDEEEGGDTDEFFVRGIQEAGEAVQRLLAAYARARLWREGAVVVLAGRVNAGKSSLLNSLLGRDRAIVSDLPGTTRDYIEESVSLSGLPVRLIDTAGLREGGDLVEEEGIRRSCGLAETADVLLFVLDGRKLEAGLHETERDFLKKAANLTGSGKLMLVVNKVDTLTPGFDAAELLRRSGCLAGEEGSFLPLNVPAFAVSAKYGTGLAELGNGIRAVLLGAEQCHAGGDLAPNLRQSVLLQTALEELDLLKAAQQAGATMDLLGFHLDAAMLALAEVTGASGAEDVLNSIFDSFCIGK